MKDDFRILDSIVDSIVILNSSGLILFTNIAWKKFEAKSLDSLGVNFEFSNYLEVCTKVTGEEMEDAILAVRGINKVIRMEIPIFEMVYPCHSVDEQRWFLMRCTPLIGLPELVVISHINITKLKLIELEINIKNKQLKEIGLRLHDSFYRIVHDIQAPLSSIEGLINLSKAENLNSKSENPYISLISKSIFNLKNIIKVTLNSTISKNKIESVNFDSLVCDFLDSIRYSERLHKIEIVRLVNQTAPFYTYKSEILSVISNLLSNSFKYCDYKKERPYVEISITANANEAVLIIKDNGIGINKDMLSKIFDLNFQVNISSIEGFGIGLNLVKKSIELMNGEVCVTSEFGLVTEFTITIPNFKNFKNNILSNEIVGLF